MDSPYTSGGKPAPNGRFILIVAGAAFLLGAMAVGYMLYSFGYLGPSQNDRTPVEAAARDPAQSTVPAILPTRVPSNETPVETVERVVEQQGGIDQRLAAAEQRIARLDLQAQAASGNAARAEGLLIAFAVRRTLERGEKLGLLEQQLRLRFGSAQPNAVDAALALAEKPVTLEQLIGRLDRIESALKQKQEEEVFARVQRELSQLFVFRRADTDSPKPERRLERARFRLQNGDVIRAISEVEQLPDANQPEVVAWLANASRYARAQQALDVLETTALLEPRRLRDAEGERVEQPSPIEQ